jgi:16S rRNA U1498 N3-methylase RsmE
MNQYHRIWLLELDFLHQMLENEEAKGHYLVHVLKSRNKQKIKLRTKK